MTLSTLQSEIIVNYSRAEAFIELMHQPAGIHMHPHLLLDLCLNLRLPLILAAKDRHRYLLQQIFRRVTVYLIKTYLPPPYFAFLAAASLAWSASIL